MKMMWIGYVILGGAVFAGAIYMGLPPLLTAMGLHQHYEIPEYNLPEKRALVIATSHDKLGDTGRDTGVFGSEMTVPYYAFLDAGLTVDLASIKGGEIPIQPWSMSWPMRADDDRRFLADPDAMEKLRNSIPITDIDVENYDAIFMAGGWGAAYDFAQSPELAELITQANAQGKIIGTVCHGALGLVNAKGIDGEPLVKGRRVTGVTNKQIKQVGVSITPKHPETELRERGAVFESATAWRDYFATLTVIDGNLITGQNQNSGYETSHRVLEKLAAND